MGYNNVEYVSLRASLAIQIIDDFTNRTVLDYPLQVWTEEGIKPIQKKDGYYVFLNIKEDLIHLHIESTYFLSYKEVIHIKQLNSLEPVIKVRLKPNRFYPLPKATTCIEGKTEPRTKLKIWCPNMTGYIRLMQDYKSNEDTKICIFNPNQTDIEGKSFYIVENDLQQIETFLIQKVENRKEEIYVLKNCLTNCYKKMSAKIYPILLLEADEEGNFFAPIPFLEKEHPKIQIKVSERELKFEQELIYGTTNSVTLEIGGK